MPYPYNCSQGNSSVGRGNMTSPVNTTPTDDSSTQALLGDCLACAVWQQQAASTHVRHRASHCSAVQLLLLLRM